MDITAMGMVHRLALGGVVVLLASLGLAAFGVVRLWRGRHQRRGVACAAARQRVRAAAALLQLAEQTLAQPDAEYTRRVAAQEFRASAQQTLAAARHEVARYCPARRWDALP